ncbi:MAG: potassium channel family protein [Carbonactinosporaceae bacterium]
MARKPARHPAGGVVVLGLGRFGRSLAVELVTQGIEVLGIEHDEKIVQEMVGTLTHVVSADTTDLDALRQLGVQEFRRAVVGVGTDLEASILTTSNLVDLEVGAIWAKAVSRAHGRILQRVGAHHVVHPEHDMGERVAHLVTGRMLDYIEFEDGFAMAKTRAPTDYVDRSLGETRIRSQHGVTVVSIKRRGEGFTYATPETVINGGDVLIVSGRTEDVERFANLT